MSEGGANQPSPVVHNGTIYLVNTNNIVQALDGRTGELIWVPVDDHDFVTGPVHLGRQLRPHPTAADYEELQGWLIIGRPSWSLRPPC